MLTYDEKALLLKRLPSFELSYENILHKKVYGDVFMLIPKGKKAILWITYWKGQNICVLLPFNYSGHISINEVELYQLCFSNEIAYGTLIYGSVFSVNNMKHFTFENIITPPNLSSFTAADNRLRLYIEWNYWDDVYMSFSDREVELKIIDKLTTITYDIMYYLNYGRNRIRTSSPPRLLRELYLHRDLLINQETINNLRDFAGLLQYITFLYKGGKKK